MIPSNIERDFKYIRPTGTQIKPFLDSMAKLLEGFKAQLEDSTEYQFSFIAPMVVDVYIRLDQRSDYYRYFHGITEMVQTKRLALLCYWVLKYKPLHQDRGKAEAVYTKHKCTINELFVLFILECVVFQINTQRAGDMFSDGKLGKNLLHFLMQTDVTKEAMLQMLMSMEMACKAS